MEKRTFLKLFSITSAGWILSPILIKSDSLFGKSQNKKLKNWIWIGTNTRFSKEVWKKQFEQMKDAGIDAILPEVFNNRMAYYGSQHLPVGEEWLETILPIAKSVELEVHAWMHSMPCNIKKIYQEHPEWFMINGNGES